MVSENKTNNLQTNKQTAFPSVKKSSGLFLVAPVLDPSLISAQPFLPSIFLCFPLSDIIQIVTEGSVSVPVAESLTPTRLPTRVPPAASGPSVSPRHCRPGLCRSVLLSYQWRGNIVSTNVPRDVSNCLNISE